MRERIHSEDRMERGGEKELDDERDRGGVSVNTFFFTILFRNCCESVMNLLWDCIESVQKM